MKLPECIGAALAELDLCSKDECMSPEASLIECKICKEFFEAKGFKLRKKESYKYPTICEKCSTGDLTEQAKSDLYKAQRQQEWLTVCPRAFRNFDWLRLPDKAKDFYNKVKDYRFQQHAWAFAGESDFGKSRMAVELARLVFLEGKSVLIVNCGELDNEVRERTANFTLHEYTEQLTKVSYLVLDDVGKESATAESVQKFLYTVLDSRTSNAKPTSWTCNLTEADLLGRYKDNVMLANFGKPIVNRLKRACDEFVNKNFLQNK